MKYPIVAASLLAAAALTGGCASDGAQVYNASEARSVESVQYGTVVSARPVEIKGERPVVGTLAGAAVGGLLGSQIGHGNGSIAGAVLGAVGGGVAGNAIEQRVTTHKGEEITVRLDTGETIAIVQPGWQDFAAGQRVQVVTGRGGARVQHA
ncbi:MAG TPA: glycine zipper 2TM domain-containing protein [Burkholderiales bacterium]